MNPISLTLETEATPLDKFTHRTLNLDVFWVSILDRTPLAKFSLLKANADELERNERDGY